ncbi:unnamed protein product [Calicophoron daubneyi]|uniref:RRM domain-containing protein n=1 Tax=Calicophoron daubneyi TaxID=300641 RepID=A0AAV2T269_CALDB
MSCVEAPDMSSRRESARFEDYSRSRQRNFPAEFDDYSKRPRGSFEDRKARPRDGDYGPPRYGRELPRSDFDDRRQNRSDRPENSFPGATRDRGGPPDSSGPKPSKILGVFGLSTRTEERHLYDIMSAYGPLDDVQMVYDTLTGIHQVSGADSHKSVLILAIEPDVMATRIVDLRLCSRVPDRDLRYHGGE